MFTVDRGLFSRSEKLHFKVANSEWSDSVVIGAEGNQGVVSIETTPFRTNSFTMSGEYQLAITVQACPAQFWRTKKVIVSPRYKIWNNTGVTLYYMQKDTNKKCAPFQLAADKIVPFYFPKTSKEPMFRINTDPVVFNWSGAIGFTIVIFFFFFYDNSLYIFSNFSFFLSSCNRQEINQLN